MDMRVKRPAVVTDELGRNFYEVGPFLVCTENLRVAPEHVDGVTVAEDPAHPENGQYFTFEAAAIHARYQGLRVPSPDDWADIFEYVNPAVHINLLRGFQDGEAAIRELGLGRFGGRDPYATKFCKVGERGFYWASTAADKGWVHCLHVTDQQVFPRASCLPQSLGSTRCVKI